MKLQFHCLQHKAFEGPDKIGEWIINNEYSLSFTKFYLNEPLPQHSDYDVLIVMGGPMGVYDESKYPWLIEEKKFLKEAISKNKKILGVCLGSQLLANVLGAKVYPNKEKEIGFFPINKIQSQSTLLSNFPENFIVFQWHGDTFDLPAGAKLLASSDVCKNQAFAYGNNVLALQFHFEVTETSIDEFLIQGKNEIVEKPYIQSVDEIKKGYKFIPTCNLLLDELLQKFIHDNN